MLHIHTNCQVAQNAAIQTKTCQKVWINGTIHGFQKNSNPGYVICFLDDSRIEFVSRLIPI